MKTTLAILAFLLYIGVEILLTWILMATIATHVWWLATLIVIAMLLATYFWMAINNEIFNGGY